LVEVASIGLKIGGVEDRPEDALNILYVLPDADLCSGLRLDVRRAGQMIGMRVRFQGPDDLQVKLFGLLQNRLDRSGVDLA
jgi:hypothetical protein